MPYILDVKHIENFKLSLTFDNKVKKIVDLQNHLQGPVFEPLKNIDYFKTVHVNPDIDTICWDNGADFSPEFLQKL